MHTTEVKIDVVFRGTNTRTPDEFISEIESKFVTQDDGKIELVDQEHGFTYDILIHDLINMTPVQTGGVEIMYFDVENKEKGHKITLPSEFTVKEIRNSITPVIE